MEDANQGAQTTKSGLEASVLVSTDLFVFLAPAVSALLDLRLILPRQLVSVLELSSLLLRSLHV